MYNISIMLTVAENPNANATQTAGATFQINNTKLHVPVVTLSINDNNKILENKKYRYSRTIS